MMIANHLGEDLVPSLLAAGAGTASVLLVTVRARLHGLGKAVRRRRAGKKEPARKTSSALPSVKIGRRARHHVWPRSPPGWPPIPSGD
jgi:hypothetical protein